jgi:hypothetical protein
MEILLVLHPEFCMGGNGACALPRRIIADAAGDARSKELLAYAANLRDV